MPPEARWRFAIRPFPFSVAKSALLVVLGVGLIQSALAQDPIILIHQRVAKSSDGMEIISDLGVAFAEEVKTALRLNPVSWTLIDPVFRDAAYNGVVNETITDPSDAQFEAGARAFKAPFYVRITVTDQDKMIGTNIQLYKPGVRRPVWQKSLNSAVAVGGVESRIQAEQALARSWVFELRQGALKDFIKTLDVPTPDVSPGTPITPDPTPEVRPTTGAEVDDLRKRVNESVQNGHTADALTLLWDRVDVFPNDLELRKYLVQTLVTYGSAEQTIEECERALKLWPAELDFRFARIKGFLALGRTEDASNELNEIIARDPENAQIPELRGQVHLLRGLLGPAREAFIQVLATERKPLVQALLALTVGLEGDTAEARRLMETLPPTDEPTNASIYHRLALTSAIAVERLAVELREVLRLGRLQPGAQSVINRAQIAFKSCEGMSGVFATARVPAGKTFSHDHRVLAQNLLNQAAAEILQFVRSGNLDTGDEATLSLGEAMKRFNDAHRSYLAGN